MQQLTEVRASSVARSINGSTAVWVAEEFYAMNGWYAVVCKNEATGEVRVLATEAAVSNFLELYT